MRKKILTIALVFAAMFFISGIQNSALADDDDNYARHQYKRHNRPYVQTQIVYRGHRHHPRRIHRHCCNCYNPCCMPYYCYDYGLYHRYYPNYYRRYGHNGFGANIRISI